MSENRRQKNLGAIQDYCDAGLEQLQPGAIPVDEMTFEKKHRGSSKTLLKESQLLRLDNERMPGEDESHRLLLALMVEPRSLLARRHPLYHHDLTLNIFGAPAGYQRLLEMERSDKQDTRERAANCRAGIEAVLTMLDERGVELVVKPVPSADKDQAQKVENRHVKTRELFKEAAKDTSRTKALKETARLSGYSERQVWKIVNDL